YIDFVRGETMEALRPYVKKAIAEGKTIAFTTLAGARFFVRNVATEDLLKMKRTEDVYWELLVRKGVRDEFRREALAGLARRTGKNELSILLDAIRKQDEQPRVEEESVVFDLVRLLTTRPTSELTGFRRDLVKLATAARLPVTRQLGYVALITTD